MAKQIKAIQCPKCGSPQKTQLQLDTYRCDSCGTEYFLDTDAITLNVRQLPPVAPPRPAMAPVPARNIRWALILAGTVLLWSLGAYLWEHHQRVATTELQPDLLMTGRLERESPSAWRSAESALVPGAGGQPLLVLAGGHTVPGQYTYTATVAFYDARTGKLRQRVDLGSGR